MDPIREVIDKFDGDYSSLDKNPFCDIVSALIKDRNVQLLNDYVKHSYRNGVDLLRYVDSDDDLHLMDYMYDDTIPGLINEYLLEGRDIENLVLLGKRLQEHKYFTFASSIAVNGSDSLLQRLLVEDINYGYRTGNDYIAAIVVSDYVIEASKTAPHRIKTIIDIVNGIDSIEHLYIEYLQYSDDDFGSYTKEIVKYLNIPLAESIAIEDYGAEMVQMLNTILWPDV